MAGVAGINLPSIDPFIAPAAPIPAPTALAQGVGRMLSNPLAGAGVTTQADAANAVATPSQALAPVVAPKSAPVGFVPAPAQVVIPSNMTPAVRMAAAQKQVDAINANPDAGMAYLGGLASYAPGGNTDKAAAVALSRAGVAAQGGVVGSAGGGTSPTEMGLGNLPAFLVPQLVSAATQAKATEANPSTVLTHIGMGIYDKSLAVTRDQVARGLKTAEQGRAAELQHLLDLRKYMTDTVGINKGLLQNYQPAAVE